jgi:crotonobetainyl-CoA:carnitine CoA-transferase CaiB-like acyl-CoA transferase
MAKTAEGRSPTPAMSPRDTLPVRAPGPGFNLLDGIRIVDLTTSVAGPYCTMLLGDMGADIIKIERPGTGDDARAWGPPFADGESLWFLSINRNKRSVVLDYATPSGREALVAIIKACDAVVVNQPPRVLKKLSIDADACGALRQDLIYVAITGFGLHGQRSDWTCYDLIAEGYSGIMDLTGDPDSQPQKIGAPAADMLAGADAAYATVAALFDRQRTGRGHVIDVSLVESMVRFLACRIVPYLGSGEVPRRSGGKDSVIAIYQAFETADHPITLGLGNDAIWDRFWTVVGRPDIGKNPKYATNSDRRAQRAAIVAEIGQILKQNTREHWLNLLASVRVPAGPINRVDEVVADPELQRRGLFFSLAVDDRMIPQVGTGFQIDGSVNGVRMAPPQLGASTVAVLREVAGLSDKEIETLRQQKSI